MGCKIVYIIKLWKCVGESIVIDEQVKEVRV